MQHNELLDRARHFIASQRAAPVSPLNYVKANLADIQALCSDLGAPKAAAFLATEGVSWSSRPLSGKDLRSLIAKAKKATNQASKQPQKAEQEPAGPKAFHPKVEHQTKPDPPATSPQTDELNIADLSIPQRSRGGLYDLLK